MSIEKAIKKHQILMPIEQRADREAAKRARKAYWDQVNVPVRNPFTGDFIMSTRVRVRTGT